MKSRKLIGPSRLIRSISLRSNSVDTGAIAYRFKAKGAGKAISCAFDTRFSVDLRRGILAGFVGNCAAFHIFLTHTPAAKHEARWVLLHDLVLKTHDPVEQRLRPRRTSRDIDINRNDAVDTLQRRIGRERAAG